MNNRDMPSSPISEEETDRIIDRVEIFTGLTKLEYAAIAAMQGLLAKSKVEIHEICAIYAVAQANALFDELEKQGE